MDENSPAARVFGKRDLYMISKNELVKLIENQQKAMSNLIEDLYMADPKHPIFVRLEPTARSAFKEMKKYRMQERRKAIIAYLLLFPKQVIALSKKLISSHKK